MVRCPRRRHRQRRDALTVTVTGGDSSGQVDRRNTARRGLLLGGLILVAVIVEACSGGRRATAYQYNWSIFLDSIFAPDPRIVHGIFLTVSIAVTSQIIGVVLGTLGALGRLSRARPIRWIANAYVGVFRGTPLLVQ